MKVYLLLFFASILSLNSNAQVHAHAIGLRGGGGSFGYGPEISYQLGLSEKNRIEFDLGWRTRKAFNNGNGWGSDAFRIVGLSGILHWDWNITEGLNWYIGPGAQIIFYDEKHDDSDDGVYFSAGGQIGLEYDFTDLGVPLHLGLDYRPMFMFSWFNNIGHGGALSIRYLID